MSKTVRKELFSKLQTIYDLHRRIAGVIMKEDAEQLLDLLSVCQEEAISIGTRIDAVYGEGTESVKKLEEYCELLFQTSEEPEKYVLLDAWMQETEALMQEEIPDKQEVVFLPYKSSMWDSLESVWMAAQADENCDAYVIPIPYFTKNPDGSFREEHWDGDDFPENVPVTRYDVYDFEVRRPDVIYIHNPYDDCNHVVSVHPFFYSNNLVKYTEQLIYIPYFVLGEINPDNEVAVEHVKGFIVTPVMVNAHKIIVQSENMRQLYIKLLTEVTEPEGIGREYWEEKIFGTGSPKFDKITSLDAEKVQIPEEWKKIIYKPDGSRKKIILYNTGVDAMIKKRDQMLVKIKNVLAVMKEHQEEIVLLWRPHPMMKATLLSVCPRLWPEYEEIVNTYRNEGWGIYDDTQDMDRAIVISDAYYGDGSSLVQLCRKTGKPVMIQNVEILEET